MAAGLGWWWGRRAPAKVPQICRVNVASAEIQGRSLQKPWVG